MIKDEFPFWGFGFPNEEQTLGLSVFNSANSKGFIVIGLKFKWRDRFLSHHIARN